MFRTRIKIVAASLLTLALLGTTTGILAFRAAARELATANPQTSSASSSRGGDHTSVRAESEPDVYALLLIEDGEPRLLPDTRPRTLAGGDPSVYRRTQAILLKSHSNLSAALKKKEVARLAVLKGKTTPERWLTRKVETTFLDNTGVLRVSLAEGSPEERATLINAVVAGYLDNQVYAEQREKEKRLEDLDKVLRSSEARSERGGTCFRSESSRWERGPLHGRPIGKTSPNSARNCFGSAWRKWRESPPQSPEEYDGRR